MSEVTCLRHFGIVVGDMPKALEFYAGLMGLRPGPTVEEQGPALDKVLGAMDILVSTVKMRAESGETLLELLYFKSPPVLTGPNFYPFYRQGPTHVAFTVKALPALLDKIMAAGCEVMSPAQPSPDNKVLFAFCRDYEGNLVELVQPTLGVI